MATGIGDFARFRETARAFRRCNPLLAGYDRLDVAP